MSFYVKKRRSPAINIVSLIDILVILLIFFIVTSSFKKNQPQVVINLPETKETEKTETENLPAIITVSATEEIYLDETRVQIEELATKVKEIQEKSPSTPIALNADRKASFGLIIAILDAMKKAGVKNLPAFTEQPES